MATVVYVYTPGNTRYQSKTLYEQLYGAVSDITHLRILGCDAYAYNFDVSRQKLDDCAIRGVFVGYDEKSSNYLIYTPEKRKIMRYTHIVFNERGLNAPGAISEGASIDDWTLMGSDNSAKIPAKSTHIPTISAETTSDNADVSILGTLAWHEARDIDGDLHVDVPDVQNELRSQSEGDNVEEEVEAEQSNGDEPRRSLLSELGFPQKSATAVYEDNKGARDLSRNPIYQKRTRHIQIKYHFVRSRIYRLYGTIRIMPVNSGEQLVDFLTKPAWLSRTNKAGA